MKKINLNILCFKRINTLTWMCFLFLIAASCSDEVTKPTNSIDGEQSRNSIFGKAPNMNNSSPVQLAPASFDLAALPNGNILVTQNGTVQQIRKGNVSQIAAIPNSIGQPAQGLAPTGTGSYFLTSGGLDLAAGAGVWHVSRGNARLIGDIEAFETNNDPDAFEGPMWKNQACEEDSTQGFSAGPQSNPYHIAALSGSTVLVGDAAGNTVLKVKKNGSVDWVALLTPPVDENNNYRFLKTAEEDSTIDCYVQPVATSVAVEPDGDYFVGELTGAPSTPGWSRIWRVEAGAEHVVCPSDQCTEFADGLTSIIDLETGPDGMLYAVEYDVDGWAAALGKLSSDPSTLSGTIKQFDISTGDHTVLFSGLTLPSAITFDKWGNLWVLENNLAMPTIRQLTLP